MLEFFKRKNIDRSKKLLTNNFERAINNKIVRKINGQNLVITSYNVHYFSEPLKSQNSIKKQNIFHSLEKLLTFFKKSESDIILLQEALFNDKIISFFRNNDYFPYVCDTYEIFNNEKLPFFYGNIILINEKKNIKVTTVSKIISLSGFRQRKKCIVNILIDYLGYKLSIYNVHLDVWDRTGKCRLEQIKNILNLVKKDDNTNILISGDFNAIKESDYSSEEKKALKDFYSTYTNNPFKEIDYLLQKGFTDIGGNYNPSSTVWSKQRVDFFFIKNGFSIPIINYNVQHVKGSDHYPISIELQTHQECINLDLLHKPLIENAERVDLKDGHQLDKKLVYEFKDEKRCEVVLKILPIWNKKWEKMVNILHNAELSNAHIIYGKKSAYNEYIITKYLSKLVEKNITFSFVKTIAAYETETLPMNREQLKKFNLLDIPNQRFYVLIQPKLDKCENRELFKKNIDLVLFQIQWALFISYKRYQFVHGDLNYAENILCYTFNFFPKKYAIFKYKDLIWKIPLFNSLCPALILFDFEFSDFTYKNYDIHSKLPLEDVKNYAIGNYETIKRKRELDILGINSFLKKMGIKKEIPNISIFNNKKLLDGFDNFKITEKELKELDKNIYILFDGTKKKI